MSPDPALRAARRRLPILVGLSVAAAELAARPPGQSPAVGLGIALSLLALSCAAGRALRPRGASGGKPPVWALLLVLGVFLLPYPLEPLRRLLTGQPRPLELLLLDSLRNLALGLAALSAWPACLRLAGLVTLFLSLFAAAMSSDLVVPALLACYAGAGIYWLMLAHWEAQHPARASPETAAFRLPWTPVLLVLLPVGGALGLGLAGPGQVGRVLAELLPTSGGTHGYDPGARGGVNDGDDEARGTENARSTGFTDSDVFLEDDRPSLYDAANDKYGEPFKPKEMERAIGLSPEKLIARDRPPAENLGASRQFPTVRRGPADARQPGDRRTDALAYVVGRTPLHLGMVAYDRFDGRTWFEAPRLERECWIESEPGGCWMRLREVSRAAIFAGNERHEVRIARLRAEQFPSPAHLAGFRVGKVDRPEFFGWAHHGVLRLRDRGVPSGVVLETESRTVDPALLAAGWCDRKLPARPRDPERPTDAPVAPEVAALARRWAGAAPCGWAQVAAVVAALRAHAVHDPAATVPSDCQDSVAYFLTQSRRGPDYQFASAAAVLLRSLGYQTRVVSGFYAAPDRYDRSTGQTPLTTEDVHFWTEVFLPDSVWVAVEPTPGYDLEGPTRPWTARLYAALCTAGRWAQDHTLALLATAIGLLALVLWRRELLDGLGWWVWRLRSRGSWRKAVLGALRLLERRSRWAGRPRPPGRTPVQWYGGYCQASGNGHSSLTQLAALADWAVYAPAEVPPPWTPDEARAASERALREWTLTQLRRACRKDRAAGATKVGRTFPSAGVTDRNVRPTLCLPGSADVGRTFLSAGVTDADVGRTFLSAGLTDRNVRPAGAADRRNG